MLHLIAQADYGTSYTMGRIAGICLLVVIVLVIAKKIFRK